MNLEASIFREGIPMPGATFYAPAQHIARNSKGTMIGFCSSQNSDLTDQDIEVWFIPNAGGSPQLVLSQATSEATGHVNPPVIEAASSGEFYAIWGNWNVDELYVAFWNDIVADDEPVIETHAVADVDGKWVSLWDEVRREVHFVNNGNNRWFRFNDEGVYIDDFVLLTNGDSLFQYMGLSIGPDGIIGFGASSYVNGTDPDRYSPIIGGWTRDLEHWYRLSTPWANAAKPAGSGVAIPALVDAASKLTLSFAHELDWNLLISAFLVDRSGAHVVYSVSPLTDDPQFSIEDGENASMIYRRYSARTGELMVTAPLLAGGEEPWLPGSVLLRRSGVLYHLSVKLTDLVVFASRDNGLTWSRAGTFPLPGTGTRHARYLSAFRGAEDDPDIIGVLTMVNCSLADRLAGVGYPQDSDVVRFTLTL